MNFFSNKISAFKWSKVKYNSIIDASHWSRVVRRLAGVGVVLIVERPGNIADRKFCIWGFICFLIWNCSYIYCAIISYVEDQTVLRNLYQTKLKRYGDDFERAVSIVYFLFSIPTTPFRLNGNKHIVQIFFDVDKALQNNGDIINYYKIFTRSLVLSITQVSLNIVRMVSISVSLSSSNMKMPVEKMFQVVYCDGHALITTSLFAYFIVLMRDRFQILKRGLKCIKEKNSWEHKLFMRTDKVQNNVDIDTAMRDRQVCEKIRNYSKIYTTLCRGCHDLVNFFGFSLLTTVTVYFTYIILYLFYFMEATAMGLFHDVSKYIDFIVYTFWEIIISIGIILLPVYYCESTMKEISQISYLLHDIINENLSPSIKSEAKTFSLQVLHEKPIFTVLGLFDLNYHFLMEGTKSICTYLIILLQFVTENN